MDYTNLLKESKNNLRKVTPLKFELTKSVRNHFGVQLFRIRALKSFSKVKKGDLGGWVQFEQNLSQDGDCWIYDEAAVYQGALVCDSAIVKGEAWCHNNSRICENAIISEQAIVQCNAHCYGNCCVSGEAFIAENVKVFDDCKISDHAGAFGNAWCHGQSKICGYSKVFGGAEITGHTIIRGTAKIWEGVYESGCFEYWSLTQQFPCRS